MNVDKVLESALRNAKTHSDMVERYTLLMSALSTVGRWSLNHVWSTTQLQKYQIRKLREGINIMARKQGYTPVTFVRTVLTEDERAHFEGWYAEYGDDLFDMLATIIEQDYKFSLSQDRNNDTWIATLTGRDETGGNAHCATSSRHKDLYAATALSVYKHRR